VGFLRQIVLWRQLPFISTLLSRQFFRRDETVQRIGGTDVYLSLDRFWEKDIYPSLFRVGLVVEREESHALSLLVQKSP
jgi:hypothetical protein